MEIDGCVRQLDEAVRRDGEIGVGVNGEGEFRVDHELIPDALNRGQDVIDGNLAGHASPRDAARIFEEHVLDLLRELLKRPGSGAQIGQEGRKVVPRGRWPSAGWWADVDNAALPPRRRQCAEDAQGLVDGVLDFLLDVEDARAAGSTCIIKNCGDLGD